MEDSIRRLGDDCVAARVLPASVCWLRWLGGPRCRMACMRRLLICFIVQGATCWHSDGSGYAVRGVASYGPAHCCKAALLTTCAEC
jgi:hypothetical protein